MDDQAIIPMGERRYSQPDDDRVSVTQISMLHFTNQSSTIATYNNLSSCSQTTIPRPYSVDLVQNRVEVERLDVTLEEMLTMLTNRSTFFSKEMTRYPHCEPQFDLERMSAFQAKFVRELLEGIDQLDDAGKCPDLGLESIAFSQRDHYEIPKMVSVHDISTCACVVIPCVRVAHILTAILNRFRARGESFQTSFDYDDLINSLAGPNSDSKLLADHPALWSLKGKLFYLCSMRDLINAKPGLDFRSANADAPKVNWEKTVRQYLYLVETYEYQDTYDNNCASLVKYTTNLKFHINDARNRCKERRVTLDNYHIRCKAYCPLRLGRDHTYSDHDVAVIVEMLFPWLVTYIFYKTGISLSHLERELR